MSEGLRRRVLEEVEFKIVPSEFNLTHTAPPEVRALVNKLKGEWARNYQGRPDERPMVAMGPKRDEKGNTVYSVRKEIVYRPDL